ncbi:MAG: LuxR C-terminal-related transcriptional regulator [Halioglobus sp.]
MATTENNTTLAAAIDALGSDTFAAALLDFIRATADFDSSVIMAYPESGDLNVLHNDLHEGDQSGFGGPYRDGLWLLSPTHLAAKAGLRGFFPILELAPDNFEESQYYALYYQSSGVVDHSIYLLESGDDCPLAISMERTGNMQPFTDGERRGLSAITETVAALVRQHWKSAQSAGETQKSALHQQVEMVLLQFGTSVLTPREREVVQLVLRGYPSKRIATALGISGQTEQVHRKNIYQKLGLSSHNELFSLFFDALVQPHTPQIDPLAALLSK